MSDSGDPTGRRISRRRAQLLAEAGRIADLLHRTLDRAASPLVETVRDIVARIAHEERAVLHRAHGHVEGRRRYKRRSGSGNPVRDRRPVDILSVDEAGVPHLQASPGPGDWFALAGVAMTQEAAGRYIAGADRLKLDFFGRTDVTLHEPLMRRRIGHFSFGGRPDRQQEFDASLDALIASCEFTAFAVGIRKRVVHEELGGGSSDPYLPAGIYSVAIQLLFEHYVDFLAHDPREPIGRVVWEAQGPREDAEHQRDFVDTLLSGTRRTSESAFRRFLEPGLSFVPKSGSHPTELSDMLARDVFEWIRDDCASEPAGWPIFGARFYRRGDGVSGEFGLTVFPDTDIKDRVAAQRARY